MCGRDNMEPKKVGRGYRTSGKMLSFDWSVARIKWGSNSAKRSEKRTKVTWEFKRGREGGENRGMNRRRMEKKIMVGVLGSRTLIESWGGVRVNYRLENTREKTDRIWRSYSLTHTTNWLLGLRYPVTEFRKYTQTHSHSHTPHPTHTQDGTQGINFFRICLVLQ